MSQISWISVFLMTFIIMEFSAWFLHRFVMHGPLWGLHEDHHIPSKAHSWWQKNDLFALFFALPSFFLILFGTLLSNPLLGSIGYGTMAYGAVYFFVHEVVIHRRWRFFSVRGNWYIEALNAAHKIHHSVHHKEGAENFGMLIVPLGYFKKAYKKSRLTIGAREGNPAESQRTP